MAAQSPNLGLTYKSYVSQVKAMYRKPVAQTSTAVIVTLFTIAFFGVAAIKPTLTTVARLLRETDDKQKYDQQLTVKLANLTDVQKKYEDNQQLLTTFDRALPPDKGLDELLAQIQVLSNQNSISLGGANVQNLVEYSGSGAETVAPEVGTDPSLYPSYVLTINVSGTNENLNAWLAQLQNIERIIQVNQISLTPNQDSSTQGTYPTSMNVQATVYWLPINNSNSTSNAQQ